MPKVQKDKADIIIIGAGLAGLSLGCLLGRAGLNVHIIDNKPPISLSDIKPSGRTVALMNSSWNILKSTGIDVAGVQHAHSGALKAMRIIDDSLAGTEPVENVFDACQIGEDQYGHNIPNGVLLALLYEQAAKIKSLTLHGRESFADYHVESSRVIARTESGLEITAPLLIGADGRGSAVRKIAGIQSSVSDYKQSALTFLISHSKPHHNMATEFHRPGGPLAFVPLPGNQSSVVWVETADKAEQLIKLKKQDFVNALQNASNGILGTITLETGLESWPLQSMRAETLTAPRMALIAEAAHVLSPITAQGLNLSLRDVAALAETLIDHARAGSDIGHPQLLRLYEKRRSTDIRSRSVGVDGMMRLVSKDSSAIKQLRRAGLKTLDLIPPLKTFAMIQGLAPPIDQGRLARGEAL